MTVIELHQASTVPRNLRTLRNLAGWSDRELGNRVGMSRARVEARLTATRDATPITLEELYEFAQVFGVPVDLLHIEDQREFLRAIAEVETVTVEYLDIDPDLPLRAAG